MTIEGLRTAPQPSEVDMSDLIGASVEALNVLGLVEDRDMVTESVAAEFKALGQAGRTGEPYIQLPRGVITLDDLVQASDNVSYANDRKYPESYVYRELWTPGVGTEGYKAEDLDNLTLGGDGNFVPHARLAVHGPASDQEPLLHFLGMPFDAKSVKRKEPTQLQAVEEAVATYRAEGHKDFAMTALNSKAVGFIALTRRFKGEAMPMTWGFMRDATLPRTTVGGDSVVGYVCSVGDRFNLYRSRGYARSDDGVGLSVGPKDLKS
ncbi:MAG: hypothetical protein ABI221_03490 [Candidatus Saccharimonadales bacterium]